MKNNLYGKIIWGIFLIVTLFLFGYFFSNKPINWGGDIIEYYGTSESLINHQSPNLTSGDINNITKVLNPAYLKDPQYYISGNNDNRYPVHFFAYSGLITPVRLFLQMINQPETKALAFTNLVIFTLTIFILLKEAGLNNLQKSLLLLIVYLSPIVYFIAWPGPEIYYICLTILAVFSVFTHRYFLAAFLAALASWQSQPLIILAFGFIILYLVKINIKENKLNITIKPIINGILLLFILSLPYLYNYWAFSTWSPWIIIQNLWTQYYGFGIQNISFSKLFEQLFDLNIGLFWYIPIIFIFGGFIWIKSALRSNLYFYTLVISLLTCLFYQTNPAWNYGTSGYGPTRHIIFLLPFIIYIFIKNFNLNKKSVLIISLFILTQSFVLSFNGYLVPNFLNSLDHSPYAKFVMNNFPKYYQPNPEIFVDRTNHTDLDYLTSAVYKYNGKCKKAYVLRIDIEKIVKECGPIPKNYTKYIIDPFLTPVDFPRSKKVIAATFLSKNTNKSIFDRDQFLKVSGLSDSPRIAYLPETPGSWKLKLGKPTNIIVPPGYIINYYSFDGFYVNY